GQSWSEHGSQPPLGQSHHSTKHEAESQRDQDLRRFGREDEDEAVALDKRGETGDAKRHQEKPKGGPELQLHRISSRSGADEEGYTNNSAQPEGGKPEARVGIKVPRQHYPIPDQVASEHEPSRGEIGQVP